MLAALSLAGCGGTTPARPDAGTQPALSSSAPPVRIGIALGGGAAKGFAHIGVIKMLEANGFAPAVVSGTSAGSVVGALYASGMNAFEMQEKAVALDEAKIRDLQLSSGGLVLGQKLEDVLRVLGAKRWDVLTKVGLPRSMPYFFGSLKVAITLAFVGTTVSEMTAANEGIGYLLISAGSSMQMGLAFAGLMVVGAMAMAMYELFSVIEKHTTGWAHRGSQGD